MQSSFCFLASRGNYIRSSLIVLTYFFSQCATPLHAQPRYHLTNLSALGTSALRPVHAYGINNRGEVVGAAASEPADGWHAFLYSGGVLTDLGRLVSNPTAAYDINDSGQIVGYSQVTAGPPYYGAQHPFLYGGGTMTDLGSLDPNEGNGLPREFAGANAINASGQIAGAFSLSGFARAFLYSNGMMTDLETLGGQESQAFDINDRGQVVGQARINPNTNINHAFIYENGVMTDLGTLAGATNSDYVNSVAQAINDNGQIVGSSPASCGAAGGYVICGAEHAFLRNGSTMVDLQPLFNPAWQVAYSAAKDINNSGDVVGNFYGNKVRHIAGQLYTGASSAFLYKDGAVYNLNDLFDASGSGKWIDKVYAINDAGWIVAGAYLLTPVPEPSAILLLVIALALSCVRRRPDSTQPSRALATFLFRTLCRPPGWLFAAGVATCVVTAHRTANAADVRTIASYGQPAPGTAGSGFFFQFGAPVLNDRGEVAFWANLRSDLITPEGIWSESSGTLAPVALYGNQAPGAASGDNFQSFITPCINGIFGCRWLGSPVALNDAGQVAFWSSLDWDTSGVWTQGSGQLTAVAISGFPAPGTANNFFQIPGFPQALPSINNSGHIAFGARTEDPRFNGIWSDSSGGLSLVGQASSLTAPALNDMGQTAVAVQRSTISNAPGLLRQGGVFVQQADALALIVPKESQPPGTASGVSFGHRLYSGLDSQTFGRPGLNNSGHVAFRALIRGVGVDVTNDEGVWSDALGSMALIAREGDQAPGAPVGITFSVVGQSAAQVPGDTPAAFGDPVLNNVGQVAFRAGLSGYGDEAGIWSTDRAGALRLVARSGEKPPGLPDGTYFNYLADSRYTSGDVFPFGDPALNDAGQIAFKANVAHLGDCIWATDRAGALKLVVSPSDRLEIAPGEFRRIEWLDFVGGTGNSDGRPSGFNNRGQVAFMAHFVGGGEGIFVSNRVAIPEPSTLLLGAVAGLALGASARRRAARRAES